MGKVFFEVGMSRVLIVDLGILLGMAVFESMIGCLSRRLSGST